jgi:hypothetical protein
MNIATQSMEPNKLSIELGQTIRWGRKLKAAAAEVAVAAVEKAAVMSNTTPPLRPTGNGLFWELLPGSPPLQRILFRSRTGHCWSYPYGYIAMIDLPSASRITLNCTDGETETISIHGKGLNRLLLPLCEHRLAMLCESDNALIETEGMIVREIQINKRQNAKAKMRM